MARVVVFGLGQQPANRLTGISDGLGAVIRLAGASGDDETRIVRLTIAAAVRHLHCHFEAVRQLSVESLSVTGQQRVFEGKRAVIIVEHRGAEAHRLRQHTKSVTERPIGHQTSMQRLAHD